MRGMEIFPGVGVEVAKVGEHRDVVEARIGAPVRKPFKQFRMAYDTRPALLVSYGDHDSLVQLVEVVHVEGGEDVFFDGVQLTSRWMDDVTADLEARGYRRDSSDFGLRFDPGFTIFQEGSLVGFEAPTRLFEGKPRSFCGGVAVAPFHYFDRLTPEQISAMARGVEEEIQQRRAQRL